MNILLLNNNPVVSRLVSLCMRDTEAVFEEASRVDQVAGARYDIVFVDDAAYNDEVSVFLKTKRIGKIVFFSSRDSGNEIGDIFDTVIKKPFLPSQIQQLIERIKEEGLEEPEDTVLSDDELISLPDDTVSVSDEHTHEDENSSFIFPFLEEKEPDESPVMQDEEEDIPLPKVLDSNDIEQIKALLEEEDEKIEPLDLSDEEAYEARKIEAITKKLEEDGLEIVEEEEILSSLSQKPKKKKSKSKKKLKKKKSKKEEVYTMEEALLAAIENMKPKKIKKLLKGAEVTIRIRFKDNV